MKNDIHSEPTLSKSDIKKLESSSIIEVEECKTNHANEIIITTKQNQTIVGILKLKPLMKNAVIISTYNYSYKSDALKLINEALKCAWELNYDVIFSDANRNMLKMAGFVSVSLEFPNLPNIESNLHAYSLSYNGIEKYYSTIQPQLN